MSDEYEIPDDTKVLVATPNFTNSFNATVHTNHIECVCQWIKHELDFNWTIIGRSFVHFARTQLCQIAVEGGFTHIFWVDDDAVIQPEFLPRFIAHDKDVVIAPYPMRKMPHEIGILESTNGNYHDHANYRNLTLDDMDKGLVEVDGGGTHCMLIKTSTLLKQGPVTDNGIIPDELLEAFKDMTPENQLLAEQFIGKKPMGDISMKEEDDLGIPYFIMPKTGTEDMYWCYKAKRKGVEIWCDTDVWADHMGFTPVVTKQWSEHAKSNAVDQDAAKQKHMDIIPGDTDKRRHLSIMRDANVSLA
tara:strand:+ start:3723 stop:4631 length:909 start_codon:yes stop_codon:yes gene_type:complete